MPAQAGAVVQCQAVYASPLVGLVNGELRCSGPVHWRTAVLTVAAAGPPLTKKEKKNTDQPQGLPTPTLTLNYTLLLYLPTSHILTLPSSILLHSCWL